MEHIEWFNKLTEHDSALSASKTAQPRLNNATLSRQLNRECLSMESVVALARGYGHNIVQALCETGYIFPDEVTELDPDTILQLVDDRKLLREFARRINADPDHWVGTFDEVMETAEEEIPLTDKDGFLNPAAVAGLTLVADSSPLEPEPGDDNYGA